MPVRIVIHATFWVSIATETQKSGSLEVWKYHRNIFQVVIVSDLRFLFGADIRPLQFLSWILIIFIFI